jgi:predicted DCC family thiol-disulfide oxidoreductase YuxK
MNDTALETWFGHSLELTFAHFLSFLRQSNGRAIPAVMTRITFTRCCWPFGLVSWIISSLIMFRHINGLSNPRFTLRRQSFPLAFMSAVETTETVLDSKVVSSRVFQNDQRPVILFDGVCNMCNSAVNLALDWDPDGKLRFAALQSNVGRALLEANGRKSDDISSIVLVTKDGAYVKSDAVLKITEALTPLNLLPLKPAAILGRILVPKFLRDVIYDGVADNRYKIMGKKSECRYDADGGFEDRFVDDTVALT